MAEGLSGDLWLCALVALVLGVFALRRELPLPVALGIMLAKVAIYLLYFAHFDTQTWRMNDDRTYIHEAESLLRMGFTPLSILTPSGIVTLIVTAQGPHFLYHWVNLTALIALGDHYYSPVALNIAFTAFTGVYFVRLLGLLGYHERYRKAFLVFFLLHWDVLAWSSFVNLKDTLMMMMTALSLYLIVKIVQKPRFRDIAALATTLFLFAWVRFYLPILLLLAAGIWALFQWKDRRKYLLAPFALLFVLRFALGSNAGRYLRPDSLLFGLIRFPLTPQPWAVASAYSFLLLPSIAHWLLLLPMIYAGWRIWQASVYARLLIIYLFIVTVLFAVIPDIQGPRHRVQITFLIAWMQFHFFWLWLGAEKTQTVAPPLLRKPRPGEVL